MKHRLLLTEKLAEALRSVLPLAVIILLICFTLVPMSAGVFLGLLVGCVLLIVGMGLFSLGADVAMNPMGAHMGAHLAKSRSIWLVMLLSFLVGALITVSEPDLRVLAKYVPSVEENLLIVTVGAGVGAFLVMAMLRLVFKLRLKWMLVICYALIFALSLFVPSDFWAIAFDSGGVTTGPMTVPFIMALGVGLSSLSTGSEGKNDSFGFVALCSVGPIMAVLTLGLIYGTQGGMSAPLSPENYGSSLELTQAYLGELPDYLLEVLLALAPVALLFVVYQALCAPIGWTSLGRIGVGLLYTLAGLALFLLGANVGFMPAGYLLGLQMAQNTYITWLLPVLGAVIGYFLVAAEPAIAVLQTQVETVTAGTIPKRALSVSISVGVAVSVGLALLRALTGISIMWVLVPGYLFAFVLMFFTDDTFSAIAFDSGGVASGPMTATFLLAMAMGACDAVGGTLTTDAFGMVSLVAMTPLISIQLLGVTYQRKLSRARAVAAQQLPEREVIIDF